MKNKQSFALVREVLSYVNGRIHDQAELSVNTLKGDKIVHKHSRRMSDQCAGRHYSLFFAYHAIRVGSGGG